MVEISKRLYQAIADSNLSYAELEKRTSLAKSSIQRYATGSTKKIPIDAVKAIATATGTSAAWIMGWTDDITSESTEYKKVDAITDIYKKIRNNPTLYKLVEKLSELNDQQLDAVLNMLSTF